MNMTELASRKLSAAAFLKEACANAGMTEAEVRELREQIMSDIATPDASELQQTIRLMTAFARSPYLPGPPTDECRVRHAVTEGARIEMARLGLTIHEVFAIGVLNAVEQHPRDFTGEEHDHCN